MLLLCKRQKTTYFVEASAQETVQQLKTKLSKILNGEKEPKDIRLQVQGKQAGTYSALDDSAALEQLGLAENAVLYLSYWIPGDPNPADGKWEPVEVPEFEPLNDEADEAAAEDATAGKGKAPAS